jgi:ssDNA-binding Zn-finger/Zn-ribbon topoisomerase 1
MCPKCHHISPGDAQEIICPECSYQGKPAGVMKVTGVPSLDVFKRNYGKANFPKRDKK